MSNVSPPFREQIVESLGLRPDLRIWVGGNNTDARREIETYLLETARPPTGPLDAAFITPDTSEEAVYFAAKLRPRLTPNAHVCVVVSDTDITPPEGTTDAMAGLVSQFSDAGFTLTTELTFPAGFRGFLFTVSPTS